MTAHRCACRPVKLSCRCGRITCRRRSTHRVSCLHLKVSRWRRWMSSPGASGRMVAALRSRKRISPEQEPAMISEQEAMAMSAEAMGNQQNQIVVDPAENDPTAAADTVDATEPDTLRAERQQETQRQIDERAKRDS